MSDLAAAKWRSSGLTDEQATKCLMEELPAERLPQMAGNLSAVPSLFLPYFDLDGNRTDFYRVRYLAPPKGFAGVVEKPQRYAQAAGSLNEVYLPPLLPEPWRAVAGNPTVKVYITEGELKAAAACARGIPTVGLGGVDVWRSAKRARPLLPPLDEFVWKGREVCIVFDSDAHTNPNVTRAQRQLAQEMLRLGAKPSIVSLTPARDGAKQGLDDYLLTATNEEFGKLVSEAPSYGEADVLWDLNERVVYVRDPGVVIDRGTRQKMLPGPFQAHHFSNISYPDPVYNKDGEVVRLVHKPAADRWLKWSGRAQLQSITYAPGQPEVVDDAWNEWTGWGVEPVQGDVTPWKELLDLLFSHDKVGRDWFEQWCAYPIQYPGTKLYTACVLWSSLHGVGKTFAGYMLGKVYGPNFIEVRKENLESTFNSWACGRQFVLGDEITGDDNRQYMDKLKGLVTRSEITVNEKHQPLYRIPDTVNYLFTSQHSDAFALDDDDRRFFIHKVVTKGTDSFYSQCDAWLRGDGPKHLYHHLLHNVDTRTFNPNARAMVTSAKREMQIVTKSELALWVANLANDPFSVLGPMFGEAAYYADLWTSAHLLAAFAADGTTQVKANGITREMQRAGFEMYKSGQPVKMADGIQRRLIIIRNVEKWRAASGAEVAEHWSKWFEKTMQAPKYHADYQPGEPGRESE